VNGWHDINGLESAFKENKKKRNDIFQGSGRIERQRRNNLEVFFDQNCSKEFDPCECCNEKPAGGRAHWRSPFLGAVFF
jgi:hypothetical protein